MEVTYEEMINIIRQTISERCWSINKAAKVITEYWRKRRPSCGSYTSSLYRAMCWKPGMPKKPSKGKVKECVEGLGISLDEVKKTGESAEENIFRGESECLGAQIACANEEEAKKTWNTVIPCISLLKQRESHELLRNTAQGLVAVEQAKPEAGSKTQRESGGTAVRYAGERSEEEKRFWVAAEDQKPYGGTPRKGKDDGKDPEDS